MNKAGKHHNVPTIKIPTSKIWQRKLAERFAKKIFVCVFFVAAIPLQSFTASKSLPTQWITHRASKEV